MSNSEHKIPLYLALTPLIILVIALTANVTIYKDDAVSGSNQIILIACAALAALIAIKGGNSWHDLEQGVLKSITLATPAILILLMVGALSGTWLVSGIIPTMIYYGLQILSPSVFLVASCLICALVSVFAGSSWTTSATMGIALMGVGKVLGINEGMVAGAILSGAYFGDKLSPLSDTTNLASASSGSELFSHIRYLTITTVPTFIVTLIVFAVIGLGISSTAGDAANLDDILTKLSERFNVNPLLLSAPIFVIAMILKKVPALPALFGGTLIGVLFAFIFQQETVASLGAEPYDRYTGIMLTLFGSTSLTTGNATLDELLSSGGMAGMLTTVWLILSAMVFGGVMEASGFLSRITAAMVEKVKSTGGLVSATAGTCVFTNLTTSDQYLAVLIPGRMYAKAYEDRNLAPENLSRTLEDSGTVTSVLVPWNTCGAFHAAVLGVSTLSYAPFAFFCIFSPIATLAVAYTGYKIKTLDKTITGDQAITA